MAVSRKPAHVDVAAWVADTALRSAGDPAVTGAEGTRTYRQLIMDAEAVRRALRESGVGPGQVVGVALPNGAELVASLLGVLAAGDAYLPVDQAGPVTRTRRILVDAPAAALIGPREAAERLAPGIPVVDPAEVFRVGLDEAVSAELSSRDWPEVGWHGAVSGERPGRLAYMYYTSGSTGEPKGAGMPMEPVLNLLRWELDRMRQRECARGGPGPEGRTQKKVLHFTRPTFDVSFEEIFATLVAGDCLVTVDEQRRPDPQYLIGLLHEHGVERAYIPPMVLAQLASSGLGFGASLRLWELVVAGGSLRLTAEVRQFLGTLDRPVLDDQYGMTEVHTVMARILAGPPTAWPTRGAFTDMVSSVDVAILDERFAEAGAEAGEICARGACVGRGYVGRPGLTADRFIPDPAATQPGARMYRTGDVGRRLPDGSIEVRGRLDDQIKLRNHRVTLGEIEHALMAVPAVTRVAVLAEGLDEHQRLVAYIVPQEHGVQLSADGLRAELRDTLPSYMIPDLFILLDNLPLNRHGKVDRARLRRRTASGVNETGMSATEAAIARIWASVLGAWIEEADADFFRCGGNSLLATVVTAQIRRHFAINLPFDAIFRFPVLAGLAKTVEDAPPSGEPPITSAPPGSAVPATAAQLGIWFEHMVRGDPCTYNSAWACRLTGPVDAGILRTALDQMIERHSVLRTVFPEELNAGSHDPVLLQRMLDECPPGYFTVIDAAAPDAVAGLVQNFREMPFDLAAGPLHRTFLIRVSPNEAVLLFTGHHIILDAWSEDLIRRELGELYSALVGGRPHRLPDAPVQYRDYAWWHDRRRGSGPLADQAGYWRARLRGAPAELPLPLRAPRGVAPDSAGSSLEVYLNPGVAGSLRAIAVQEGVTPLIVMLSVFGLALKEVCGTDDVLVGMAASGRARAGLEESIGLFVNSLPVRMELAEQSFREVLAEVRGTVLGAVANQDIPFDEIVRAVAPPRLPGRNPLFQAWFSFDDAPARLAMDGVAANQLELPVSRVKFDLLLHVRWDGTAIRGEVNYRSSLVSAQTADRIARAFESVAAAAAEMSDPREAGARVEGRQP
jgi:amino acid adenylation domain-containing protein